MNLLPGVNTGTTIEDLEHTVDRATGYRKAYKTQPKVQVTFGVPPALYERMTSNVVECHTSMAQLCRAAVEDFLNRLEYDAK